MAPIVPLELFTAPAVKAITRLRESLTYENVPSAVEERPDSRPYLGHVPYFAPKLADKHVR